MDQYDASFRPQFKVVHGCSLANDFREVFATLVEQSHGVMSDSVVL